MRLALVLLLIVGVVSGQSVERFDSVEVCGLCHSELPPPATSGLVESSVGPAALWPGSMMAHAARDPYWKARVQFEAARLPELAGVIEDTCLSCHAPMQQYDLRLKGERLALDDLNAIGRQGVACTVCHQITEENLGTKESFEAHFRINDQRENYGPHANPFSHPMEMHSGYTPVHKEHILESSLCATCHTVITPTVASSGKIVGEFVEQAPYLEWLVSEYGDLGMSCQDCHLPVLEDKQGRELEQYIAHNPMRFPFPPTSPRKPFGRHVLAGGNVTVLEMMKELFPDEAGQLGEKQRQTRRLLDSALSLAVKAERKSDHYAIGVEVSNNTGHKLPTGYPSRRVWLHVTVTGEAGRVHFESGGWDERTGEITGLTRLEPHHGRITEASQVMIYEVELEDTDGNVTPSLLRAARHAKDNRLLPAGFDLSKKLPEGIAASSIEPVGTSDDAGFRPGGHTVVYEVPVTGEAGPHRVVVEALYQSVKPAHAAHLRHGGSKEEKTFVDLHARHHAPVLLARAELVLPR